MIHTDFILVKLFNEHLCNMDDDDYHPGRDQHHKKNKAEQSDDVYMDLH